MFLMPADPPSSNFPPTFAESPEKSKIESRYCRSRFGGNPLSLPLRIFSEHARVLTLPLTACLGSLLSLLSSRGHRRGGDDDARE